MGLYRVLHDNDESGKTGATAVDKVIPVNQNEWLDACQNEYDVLVARLRFLDDVLVRHGRKRSYLLPKRIK